MLVKTITFEDYNGEKRTEKHRFNLTQSELLKWATMSGAYTVDKAIARMLEKEDRRGIVKMFEDLIYLSYGELSEDGRRFNKSEEVKLNFMETNAYDALFTELLSDAGKAAEFLNGVIPKKLREEADKYLKENPEGIPEEIRDYLPKNDHSTQFSVV